MKKLMIALVAVMALTLVSSYALADRETQKINGILIDQKCGTKDGKPKSEDDASKHPQACTIKCAGGGDLMVISGDKAYKLDEASKAKALEYLGSEKGEGATRVQVE